jgi:murein L,D-transpeptidase YafK
MKGAVKKATHKDRLGNMKFVRVVVLLICGILVTSFANFTSFDFKSEQVKHERVKQAFDEKEIDLKTRLLLRGVDSKNFEVYIRAFKLEEVIEVWARTNGQGPFIQIANYPFCSTVGRVGPKRQQGDKQIPEGFYSLEEFNPESNFHLSLKVNYPNKADSILGSQGNLGGLIYIHGGCETIGCIPITDDKVKELYVISVLARDNGQDSIPIHIFPARMNYANYRMLTQKKEDQEHFRFWGSLRTCYMYFEQNAQLPGISVNNKGEYLFSKHGG